jgi:histidine triad (HIT) family protein
LRVVPSIFTKIIDGEIPGVFVWRDAQCVAFLSIAPMMPGHTLVVPRREVDHWIDLDPVLARHLFTVAQTIGKAQEQAFHPRRIGVMIVGDEVPHTHIHVVPINSAGELSFGHADNNPPEGSIEAAAEKIRAALRELGAENIAE